MYGLSVFKSKVLRVISCCTGWYASEVDREQHREQHLQRLALRYEAGAPAEGRRYHGRVPQEPGVTGRGTSPRFIGYPRATAEGASSGGR